MPWGKGLTYPTKHSFVGAQWQPLSRKWGFGAGIAFMYAGGDLGEGDVGTGDGEGEGGDGEWIRNMELEGPRGPFGTGKSACVE